MRHGAAHCSEQTSQHVLCRALDTGLDPIAMRGLRLSTPNTCQPSAAARGSCALDGSCGAADLAGTAPPACPIPQAANLTVYVGSSIDELAWSTSGGGSSTLCANNVTVLPGQLVDVDCGRLMHGALWSTTALHTAAPIMRQHTAIPAHPPR